MSTEPELIKQFIKEHPKVDYMIPPDYIILREVSNTPTYLREYFEWKGKRYNK